MHLCQHASRWSEGLFFCQIIWSSESWCQNHGNFLHNCYYKNAPSFKNWKLCQGFHNLDVHSKWDYCQVLFLKKKSSKRRRSEISSTWSTVLPDTINRIRKAENGKNCLTYTRNWKWCQGFHNLDVHSISEYCQVL